ncbi:hypothetical protein vseg_015701 [Gypsophila vaccaria]
MSSSGHTIPNSVEPSQPLVLVNFANCSKLTSLSYLPWKTQIESILFGYDLYKFIDGSYPCPSGKIDVDSKPSPNPAFQTWQRQDKLLLGALLGTISPSITSLV